MSYQCQTRVPPSGGGGRTRPHHSHVVDTTRPVEQQPTHTPSRTRGDHDPRARLQRITRGTLRRGETTPTYPSARQTIRELADPLIRNAVQRAQVFDHNPLNGQISIHYRVQGGRVLITDIQTSGPHIPPALAPRLQNLLTGQLANRLVSGGEEDTESISITFSPPES